MCCDRPSFPAAKSTVEWPGEKTGSQLLGAARKGGGRTARAGASAAHGALGSNPGRWAGSPPRARKRLTHRLPGLVGTGQQGAARLRGRALGRDGTGQGERKRLPAGQTNARRPPHPTHSGGIRWAAQPMAPGASSGSSACGGPPILYSSSFSWFSATAHAGQSANARSSASLVCGFFGLLPTYLRSLTQTLRR